MKVIHFSWMSQPPPTHTHFLLPLSHHKNPLVFPSSLSLFSPPSSLSETPAPSPSGEVAIKENVFGSRGLKTRLNESINRLLHDLEILSRDSCGTNAILKRFQVSLSSRSLATFWHGQCGVKLNHSA